MRPSPRVGLPALTALSALVVPVVLLAPVATVRPSAAPHPVAPRLHTLALPAPAAAGTRSLLRSSVVALPEQRTAGFSTVGVTWQPSATSPHLDVQVRTRTRGAWTRWVDLEGQTDDAADSTSADAVRAGVRSGTRPEYVGPSDGVQVRVAVASGPVPRGLRVDLVDPGTSPADVAPARPRDVAEAAEPQPAVVTRAQWGADESIRTCFAGYTGSPKVAFVHHTDSTNAYAPSESAAAVRGFYAYHVKSNGWCDIGYNYLVDRYGTVFEGRYGGLDKAVLGAHTAGFNTNSFGVAMIGDFGTTLPPEALRTSLARLIAWRLGLAGADPLGTASLTAQGTGSRFAAGTPVRFSVVSGHRDAVSTSCPGDVGYTILGRLRTDVRADMGTGLVAPTAAPLSVPLGGGPVAVGAGLLLPVSWQLSVTSVATGAVVRTRTGSASSRLDTSWDLRDGAGSPVPAGSYRLTLTGGPASDPVVPFSATVTVQAPYAAPAPPSASPLPSGTGSSYVPLTPVRVLDTRSGTGGRSTPLSAGAPYDLVLAGRAGVPSQATAVALNLTATHASAGTHLTVWPAGSAEPATSVLNLRPGPTAASLVMAGLGVRGAASIATLAGTVDVVGDVVGYWTRGSGALYHPVAPARLLDTRKDGGPVGDGATRRLPVVGSGGVPAGATAVVLNVTALGGPLPGYLTVAPSGTRPPTSSVNFAAREVVPNRVVSALSSDGAVDVTAAGGAQVLVDVAGWYGPAGLAGGSAYTPVAPARLVDSRSGTGTTRGPFGAGESRDVQVAGVAGVPAGATAVVLSLTGTGATATQTFVNAFPGGTSLPATSDLNLLRGETRANLAVVPLSADGRMTLYNQAGTTQVVADVLGYDAAP